MDRHFSSTTLSLIVFSLTLLGVACGSVNESHESTFVKINPDQTIRDFSSFDGARFKLAKEYDITGLPMAIAAYMGYFTPPDSEPIQYELRIYPDHVSAVEKGIEYAEEVTGAEALLRAVDVRWDEGTKDRRGGGFHRHGLTPLYGDYVVVGNVIMLCEGRDSDQALSRCEALLLAVEIGK